jgi:hypothetical protein
LDHPASKSEYSPPWNAYRPKIETLNLLGINVPSDTEFVNEFPFGHDCCSHHLQEPRDGCLNPLGILVSHDLAGKSSKPLVGRLKTQ